MCYYTCCSRSGSISNCTTRRVTSLGEDQRYYIKSRLLKKLRIFIGTELPLLLNAGLLSDEDLAAFSKDLAVSCKVSNASVAQPGRALAYGSNNNNENDQKKSLGRALIPRPLPHWSGGTSSPCASVTQAPHAPYQGNALPG